MHCHGKELDYNSLVITIDETPIANEESDPKTYSFPAGAVTQIGHRSVAEWKQIINMHVCAGICCAAVGGLLIGSLVTCLIKRK